MHDPFDLPTHPLPRDPLLSAITAIRRIRIGCGLEVIDREALEGKQWTR